MRWFATTLLLLGLTTVVEAQVEEGKPAPEVTLDSVTAKGTSKVTLSSFKGKKNVVLFFYPKAMTPGCTKESCGFSEIAKKFETADTVVFGISTDNAEAQGKFIEKEKLVIPLLADPEKKVTKAFGAFNDTRGAAFRYTYVIDKEGNVAKVYKTVTPASHPEEVLKFINEKLKK